MTKIDEIRSELTINPAKGLNAIQPVYITTTGSGQAEIEINLSLINDLIVERYTPSILSRVIKEAFIPTELYGPSGLTQQQRADFGEFITNLYLHDEYVENPSGNLKTLIDGIIGGVSATNFDAIIREFVSPATYIGISEVNYSEMEEAMNQEGWL